MAKVRAREALDCCCQSGSGDESGSNAAQGAGVCTSEAPTLADRLDAAFKRIERVVSCVESVERADGLTPAQRRTLEALCVCPRCTCRTLADETGVSASTLTRHIDPLVDAGLVERSEGDDRRVIYLCCTPTGMESGARIREGKQVFLQRIIARIPERRREAVVEALEELIQAFDASYRDKCR